MAGSPGSGKTTLGCEIARLLNAVSVILNTKGDLNGNTVLLFGLVMFGMRWRMDSDGKIDMIQF